MKFDPNKYCKLTSMCKKKYSRDLELDDCLKCYIDMVGHLVKLIDSPNDSYYTNPMKPQIYRIIELITCMINENTHTSLNVSIDLTDNPSRRERVS